MYARFAKSIMLAGLGVAASGAVAVAALGTFSNISYSRDASNCPTSCTYTMHVSFYCDTGTSGCSGPSNYWQDFPGQCHAWHNCGSFGTCYTCDIP